VSNIVGALFYLRVTSLRNATLSRLRRLKQPKYLAGGVIGVAYLYFAFFRRAIAHRNTAAIHNTIPDGVMPLAVGIGALCLLIFVLLCWVWPRERASLRFSEAEIAFLFPAPVRRRTLIHYQLLSSQIRILFTALVMTLFSTGWGFVPGGAVIRIVGWWIIVATVSLHIMGSSFVITKLLDSGVTTFRRQVVTIGAFVLALAGLFAWICYAVHAPNADDFKSFAAITDYLSTIINSGPLPWILWPAKAVIQPLLAPDPYSLLLALGPAFVVYVAHYLWVVNTEVSFEEASIARAERLATKMAARQQGKYRAGLSQPKARRAPFVLGSARRVELAFLWKNLLSTAPYLRPRTAIVIAMAMVALCSWFSGNLLYEAMRPAIAIIASIVGAYSIVLGPQIARQDLRNDLANTDMLKTYPLHGWQVVSGEILTPMAIITVLVWLALLAAALTLRIERLVWLTPQLRVGVAVSVALIVPFLCTLQLLVLNTAAILFPAWLQSTRQTSGGIDVMGQRLLFLAGNLLVVVVALLPAAVVASLLFFTAQWMVGDVLAGALGVIAILAILGTEAWLGIRWLGSRFERFDLSAELRA
jgi:hypothetical protein